VPRGAFCGAQRRSIQARLLTSSSASTSRSVDSNTRVATSRRCIVLTAIAVTRGERHVASCALGGDEPHDHDPDVAAGRLAVRLESNDYLSEVSAACEMTSTVR
jgi:hypothetical protein